MASSEMVIFGMEERVLHEYICYFVLSCGFVSFILLCGFISAPYGRHASKGFGMMMNAKVAWILMESPNLWISAICTYLSWNDDTSSSLASIPNQILLSLFLLHYTNRALIYPLRMKSGNPVPFTIFLSAFTFCSINGYLQARFLTHLKTYDSNWLYDPRFQIGVFLWFCGFYLNLQADDILRNLRKPGDTERYKIPYGGLFEYISAANFFSEILEWFGFAIACWSLPALTFAIFTFCNTAPRGHSHHKWYLDKFREEYPKNRKAVIPFIW